MKCPQCKSSELVPTALEQGLVGAGCEGCHGILLSLINYRYWVDHHEPIDKDSIPETVDCGDSAGAKFCPKCNKIMTKYRIGLSAHNRVDLCGHCDEAWLDSGEWNLLKSLDIQDHLPEIFTEAWQRKIRAEYKTQKMDEHFSEIIGEDDFKTVKAFRQWMKDHEKSSDIIHYITMKFD